MIRGGALWHCLWDPERVPRPPRWTPARQARLRPTRLLAIALLGACTKVNEQPILPAAAEIPEAAQAAKKPAPRPPARGGWKSAFASDRPSDPPARLPRTPDAAPPAETLNGDPEGLKREALQKALDAAMPAFAACFDGSQGSVNVSLSFDADPSGRARNLRISGGGAAAERCVSGVAAGLALPTFTGAAVPVHFPLSIRASAPVAAPAPAAKAEPAKPAPVFVNP
jgi:hypothetical protein